MEATRNPSRGVQRASVALTTLYAFAVVVALCLSDLAAALVLTAIGLVFNGACYLGVCFGIRGFVEPPKIEAPQPPQRTPKMWPALPNHCYVCGVEDDGQREKVFGNPNHPSCLEWLGDWKPPKPVMHFSEGKRSEHGVLCPCQRCIVKRMEDEHSLVERSTRTVEILEAHQRGLLNSGEARELMRQLSAKSAQLEVETAKLRLAAAPHSGVYSLAHGRTVPCPCPDHLLLIRRGFLDEEGYVTMVNGTPFPRLLSELPPFTPDPSLAGYIKE